MRHTIALLAFVFSSVSSGAPAKSQSVYVPDLECVGGELGLRLPSDIRELKRLSQPVKQELIEVENWPGYTATWNLLHFDGLTLGVVEFSNDPARYLLFFASVASPTWNGLSPIQLMQPISQAAAVLGTYAIDNPGLSWPFEDEGDTLTIHSREGLVSEVIYQCYPG
jgi:hypothetical protein